MYTDILPFTPCLVSSFKGVRNGKHPPPPSIQSQTIIPTDMIGWGGGGGSVLHA